MAVAVDVARYFLSKVDRDAGDAPTHLWVQKEVFYAQAWSLVFLGRPLFKEQVEAWENGPVIRSVWREYKQYERNVIPAELITFEDVFCPEELKVLSAVWERYGGLTAGRLWQLTHSEAPWNNARIGLQPTEKSNNPISLDDMRVYYGDFGGLMRGEFFIEKRAADINKGETAVTIWLTDGRQEQVDLKDLGAFVAHHAGKIQYEQSSLPGDGAELF